MNRWSLVQSLIFCLKSFVFWMDILLWFFVVANLKHFLTLTNWWWSTTQKKWQIIHENVVRTPNNRSHAIQSIFHFKSLALMNASFLSGVFFAWNNQSSCQLKLYSFQSYLKLLFLQSFLQKFSSWHQVNRAKNKRCCCYCVWVFATFVTCQHLTGWN